MLRRFGVGMAPSAWDQVLTGSQRAGFKVDELLAAGLIQKGRQGGHYDRFRSAGSPFRFAISAGGCSGSGRGR